MNRPYEIVILGSGTSTGIPVPGCRCNTCSSCDPHDKRLRTSIMLTTVSGKKILVDTTPDLRTQLLNEQVNHIDAAIITHTHADHLHGIDDLRPLCFTRPDHNIPIYTSSEHAEEISARFPYIFRSFLPMIGGGIPLLHLHPLAIAIDRIIQTNIEGETFHFFLLPHGRCTSVGFVYEHFAYLPDCEEIPEEISSFLSKKNLDYLLITCLQPHPHDTHLNTEACFTSIENISPLAAGLIHINHHLCHQELCRLTQTRFSYPVAPVNDGMKIALLSKAGPC